jgi:heme/copper-type cytochrome/quinol oxidase subunit 4
LPAQRRKAVWFSKPKQKKLIKAVTVGFLFYIGLTVINFLARRKKLRLGAFDLKI